MAARLKAVPSEARSPGRRVAGQDPAKRAQILDGAKRCFMLQGFEAASMNDITAEAGVSKGTIYVYFADKEDLFAALIDRERTATFAVAREGLDQATTPTDALEAFGTVLTERLTSAQVIRAQRMVLGIADRMPALAQRFFGPEPFSAVEVLVAYLDRQVTAGALHIADTELAARQFIDLAMAPLFKRRLFGNLPDPPSAEDIAQSVKSGVAVFLAYYG